MPAPPKVQRPHKQRLPIDRAAVKSLSLAGVCDPDIAAAFPGLTSNAIKQWRFQDPQWKAAYRALKEIENPTSAPAPTITAQTPKTLTRPSDRPGTLTAPTTKAERTMAGSNQTLTEVIENSLSGIAERNSLRMARVTDKALAKFERRPAAIKDWTQAGQAYRINRLATGQDSGEGPSVSLNIWGAPGVNQTTTTEAFRDVSPPPDHTQQAQD